MSEVKDYKTVGDLIRELEKLSPTLPLVRQGASEGYNHYDQIVLSPVLYMKDYNGEDVAAGLYDVGIHAPYNGVDDDYETFLAVCIG